MLLVCLTMIYSPQCRLSPRAARLLNYGGDVSYPLYLCHMPTLVLLSLTWGNFLNLHPESLLAQIFSLVAVFVYHAVDAPMRRYARRRRVPRVLAQPKPLA